MIIIYTDDFKIYAIKYSEEDKGETKESIEYYDNLSDLLVAKDKLKEEGKENIKLLSGRMTEIHVAEGHVIKYEKEEGE